MIRPPLVALFVALLVVAPASALAAAPRASFNDVEDEVMCDTCNVPLNIAESPRADQERQVIRRLIARGLTKQQILDELKREYGPAILAAPQSSGFGLAAYLVPIGVGLVVIALLAAFLPRWRRRARNPSPAGPALSGGDARRVEEDLARYDL